MFLTLPSYFHLDSEDKVLTPPVWQSYVDLFAESVFEVHETMGWVDVEERPGNHQDKKRVGIKGD